MKKQKYHSPTLELVLQRFETAMSASDHFNDAVITRIMTTLRSEEAVNQDRLTVALFPPDDTGEEGS